MSYQRGLEIGNAYMNMGSTVANSVALQKRSKREDERLAFEEEDQARKEKGWATEDLTAEYANKLRENPGWTPEAEAVTTAENAGLNTEEVKRADKKRDHAAWWKANTLITKEQTDKALNTKAGVEAKRAVTQEQIKEGSKYISRIELAIRNGATKDEIGKIYTEWLNKYPTTGNSITGKVGEDKYEFTNWEGAKSVKTLTPNQMLDNMTQFYQSADKNEFGGLLVRRGMNIKALEGAKHYKHKKTGEIITHLEGKMFDPATGLELDSFFTTADNPNEIDPSNKIPNEKVNLSEYDLIPDVPPTEQEREKTTKEGLKTDAEIGKIEAETEYISGGKSKTVPTAERKYQTELDTRHLVGVAQQQGIPVEYDEELKAYSGQLDKKQYGELKGMAEKLGLTVYASEDKGVYTIKDIIPNRMEDGGGGGEKVDYIKRLVDAGKSMSAGGKVKPASTEPAPTEPAPAAPQQGLKPPEKKPVRRIEDASLEELNTTPLQAFIEAQKSKSQEEKEEIRKRKEDAAKRAFLRQPPARR